MCEVTNDCCTVVVADASVLIDLIITGRLEEFDRLDGYCFVVPEEVLEEVGRPEHQAMLEGAIANGAVGRHSADAIEITSLPEGSRGILSVGELAAIVIAERMGGKVAVGSCGVLRRFVIEQLGSRSLWLSKPKSEENLSLGNGEGSWHGATQGT